MYERPFTAEVTPLSDSSTQHMWELLAGNRTTVLPEKFEIIGHLQQMVHDHGFYSKIINEIGNLSVLLLRLPLKTHI